ncbi:MAG: LysM peptidoglycan-binding domain-containing protein [Dermatophilaceae bacterium]
MLVSVAGLVAACGCVVAPLGSASAAVPAGTTPVLTFSLRTAADQEKYYVVPQAPSGAPETLFLISQRLLGSGQRFQEIFELNRGRVQPDGSRVTDPQVLAPGWILRLPADAQGSGVQVGSTDEAIRKATRAAESVAAPSAQETPPSARETPSGVETRYYVVSPDESAPDSLSEIAEQFLGSGDRVAEIFELNVGREQPGGRVVRDPNEIRDGWLLALPPDAEGEGVETGPLPSLEELNALNRVRDSGVADASDDTSGSALWLAIGGGVVALVALAGLGAWLVRRRHADGARSGPASSASTTAVPRRRLRWPWMRSRSLGPGPDADAGVWTVDRALRVLATSCSASGRGVPGIYAVVADGDAIRLRLTGPDPDPPPSWTAADGARTWSAPLRVLQSDAVDTGGAAPFPHLVSIGDSARGRVLLDLARAQGVISLDGDAAAAAAVADAWCTELAQAPWSGEVPVVRVGPGGEDAPPARARADDLEQAESAIAELGGGVLVISRSSRADAARIAELARHAWTVVVVGAIPWAKWRMKVDADGRVDGGPLDAPVQSRVRIRDLKTA